MIKKKSFFLALLAMLCFCITKNTLADEVTFNNGFEDGAGNWKTNNSNITFNVSIDPVFEGIQSAQVTNTSSGSYGIEQTISGIQENTDYLMSGKIKITDPPPSKAFIRIAWYESPDGSGSQIKTEDSEIIAEITDWKILSFVAKAPTSAHSAKIRLLVSTGTAYFDSIIMEFNISPTAELTVTPTESVIPTPTEIFPSDMSYNNIYISEIMVYPESGSTEWIEFYNDNNYEVTLTDWYIDDIDNAGSSPKKFTMTIAPKGFAVLDISTAMFNNDSDNVRILDSEEVEKDSVSYTSSQKNYSLGKTTISVPALCFQNPTKNTANTNCITIIPSATTAAVSPTKKQPDPTLKKTPSPTPGSKKLLPTLKTGKITSAKTMPPFIKKTENEDILGTTIEIESEHYSPVSLIHTLTILAFSYSILSIISIISKLTIQKRVYLQ
jgi:hypothetical protein